MPVPGGVTVNCCGAVTGVGPVRVTGPVVAAGGTTAVSWCGDVTANEAASTPAKATPVTPRKLLPVTVTSVPAGPLTGVTAVTAGQVAGAPWPVPLMLAARSLSESAAGAVRNDSRSDSAAGANRVWNTAWSFSTVCAENRPTSAEIPEMP